jgi:ABC-type transporter Mla subunit MlaD
VSVAHLTALDALWVFLSAFLVVVSLVLVYLVMRLRSTAERLVDSLDGLETKATPALRNVETTVERLNARLDRIDRVADRAAGALSRLDRRLETLTSAVSRRAQSVSTFARGDREPTG